MSAPGKPDPPELGEVTSTSIELFWDLDFFYDDGGKRRYYVEAKDTSLTFTSLWDYYDNSYQGYSTQHTFENLKPGTEYGCKVQIENDHGCSEWSDQVFVNTPKEAPFGSDLHKVLNLCDGDPADLEKILQENSKIVDVPDKLGSSPLMICSKKGYTDVARVLLEYGADPSLQDASGRNSLMIAAYSGQLEIVKILREHGSPYTAADRNGMTVMHWAAEGANPRLIEWMIKDGAPVDSTDPMSDYTPLMRLASIGGNVNAAKILIRNGADVNKADQSGKSILMTAAMNGFYELVLLLVENKADVLYKNSKGKMALDFAKSFDRFRIVRFLEGQVEAARENLKNQKKNQLKTGKE